MALARFFEKSAKAAAYVVQGLDSKSFAARLEGVTVGIGFDRSALDCAEGIVAIELAVDLLSRLYPRIAFLPRGDGVVGLHRRLRIQARKINSEIELVPSGAELAACISVGKAEMKVPCNRFYIGSDGWVARLSSSEPVKPGRSPNPFGAAAAACFGVANVFRSTFADLLPHGNCDSDIRLCTLNYRQGERATATRWRAVDCGRLHLVGAGAIGCAAVWALSRTRLSGVIDVIDHESIELSNLQRYVGTTEGKVGATKVEHASTALRKAGMRTKSHRQRWDAFAAGQADRRFDRVLVAVDTANDRVMVQGSLPRRVLNAWTQPGDLGVSRHDFLGKGACLACLYMPQGKELDLDQLVMSSLGLPQHYQGLVRQLLYSNAPIGRPFLELIAQAKKVDIAELLPLEGKPLRAFYQEAVCGSMILNVSSAEGVPRGTEVPMAFQSALAGVLLAAEAVADAGNLRNGPLPETTRINLLRPLPEYLTFSELKRPGDRCICQDPDFRYVYKKKYR